MQEIKTKIVALGLFALSLQLLSFLFYQEEVYIWPFISLNIVSCIVWFFLARLLLKHKGINTAYSFLGLLGVWGVLLILIMPNINYEKRQKKIFYKKIRRKYGKSGTGQ